MRPRGLGVPRIIIQYTFHFVPHAQHSGRADFQRSALIEKKLCDVGVANLGCSLYGCLSIVLVPSIRCVEEFRVLSEHLLYLPQVSMSSDDEFPDQLGGRWMLLRLHKGLLSSGKYNLCLDPRSGWFGGAGGI